jgi:hypothetical protein
VFAEKKHILCKSAAAFLQTLSSYLPYNETTDLFLGHVAERSISRGLFQAILPLLISKRRKKVRVEHFVQSVLPLYNHDDFRQRYH